MTQAQDLNGNGLKSPEYSSSVRASRAGRGSVVPELVHELDQGEEKVALSHTTSRVAIAIDPVALITTECITVTSAMRKHARWAHSSVSAILGGSSSSSYRHAPSTSPNASGSRTTLKRLSSGTIITGDASGANDDDSLSSRWGLRGKKGKSMLDNPLMSAFARLRSDLKGCKGRCQNTTF